MATQTTLPLISCYIRTKNEERMISEVVHAALQVAAEVVVIDSGSTDKTIELSESAGARVVNAPWLGWGKQKRLGEEAAKHDWLLDIDADEIITSELAKEINELFAKGEPPCPVYQLILVTNPPVGRPWWNANIVKRNRLYDRRKIRARDHAAWDQLVLPSGMLLGRLNSPMLHYSFHDLTHLNDKFNHSSSSRAKDSELKRFWWVVLRTISARPFYFFQHYIMRGMWRYGLYGLAVAKVSAHGRWLKDAKMLEIHLQRKTLSRRD